MQHLQSFKFELMSTAEQQRQKCRFTGSCSTRCWCCRREATSVVRKRWATPDCARNSLLSAVNRQMQAQFHCVECGFEENADVIGAMNALRAGHTWFACEVSDAAMPPPAAGTHQIDSRAVQCRA